MAEGAFLPSRQIATRICLGLLLLMAGIELNPGPNTEEPAQLEEFCEGDMLTVKLFRRLGSEMMREAVQEVIAQVDRKIDKVDKRLDQFEADMAGLKAENAKLIAHVGALEKQLEENEKAQRQFNVIFNAVPYEENEKPDDTKAKLAQHIEASGLLGIHINHARRLYGKKGSAPLTVLAVIEDRASRDRLFLKNKNLRAEGLMPLCKRDYPLKVRKIRQALYPFLVKALAREEAAFLRDGYLIINGKQYGAADIVQLTQLYGAEALPGPQTIDSHHREMAAEPEVDVEVGAPQPGASGGTTGAIPKGPANKGLIKATKPTKPLGASSPAPRTLRSAVPPVGNKRMA